mmetsp:Transcript_58864/g.127322  ORF Transcript_58864/g.127322 Transcript_58864/m.127322 type:complete len:195 (-) Transcript_58864:152-736(-)
MEVARPWVACTGRHAVARHLLLMLVSLGPRLVKASGDALALASDAPAIFALRQLEPTRKGCLVVGGAGGEGPECEGKAVKVEYAQRQLFFILSLTVPTVVMVLLFCICCRCSATWRQIFWESWFKKKRTSYVDNGFDPVSSKILTSSRGLAFAASQVPPQDQNLASDVGPRAASSAAEPSEPQEPWEHGRHRDI